jgi:multidrug transporter EmrE-like cation transporter
MHTLLLILIVTFCTIGSQLLLKHAIGGVAPVLREQGPVYFVLAAIQSPLVIAAVAIQAAGFVVWWFVLTQERLSVAFAVSGSFFYLVMAAASWLLYGEKLTAPQWGGLALITIGVVVLNLFGQQQR